MIKMSIGDIKSKDDFDKLLKSCCNTMMRNKNKLWNLYQDYTFELSVTFPFRVGEVMSMEINCSKIVYDEKKEKIEIKKGEDKK